MSAAHTAINHVLLQRASDARWRAELARCAVRCGAAKAGVQCRRRSAQAGHEQATRRRCAMQPATYPVQFAVDYPDRPLDRLTTLLRLFVAIPILIVLASVAGGTWEWSTHNNGATAAGAGAGGLLFFAPLLMIVFRQKYPRWW